MEHPLIQNLVVLGKDASQTDVVERSIIQVFEGAQLLEGVLESPTDFVDRMTRLMVVATGGEKLEDSSDDS